MKKFLLFVAILNLISVLRGAEQGTASNITGIDFSPFQEKATLIGHNWYPTRAG